MTTKFKFSDCPLPPGSWVWAYLRDSGGDSQDTASQRAYLLAYCEHYQLRLARLFEDAARPGGSVVGRDEFDLMISMARSSKQPQVDAILYWDIKRFARNQLDSQFFKSDLRRRGYRLISLSDDIPDSSFSSVIESFLEWKAQQDLLDISKDSKRGLQYIVGLKDAAGNYLGIFPGQAPVCFTGERYNTGLRRNDGSLRLVQRLIPDPEIWSRGQRAWQMRSERASYNDIQAECRLYQAKFVNACYRSFFRNEIYIGRLHYGGQVYEDFVPHLTTPEVWAAAQELNFKRPQKGQPFTGKIHPKTGRSDYLLSGLCKCLYCGSPMHGSQNSRGGRQKFWRYYRCAMQKAHPDQCEASQVSALRLEEAIIAIVSRHILTFDFVDKLVEQVNLLLADDGSTSTKIEELRRHLAALERNISNLLDLAERHGSASVLDRLIKREQERDIARRDLAQLENQTVKGAIMIDKAVVIDLLGEMNGQLNSDEVKLRKLVLQQTVDKAEVGRDIARLYCKFPIERTTRICYIPPTPLILTPLLFSISY